MTIRFDIDINDLLAFQRNVWANDKTLRRKNILIKWLSPAIYLGIILWDISISGLQNIIFIALLLLLAALMFLYISFSQTKGRFKRARKIFLKPENQSFMGERELSFNAHEITIKEKHSASTVKWEEIRKTEETQDHFFLFNTGLSAYIIPKQKITTDDVERLQLLFKEHISEPIETK